jgi:hypothetical protein
MPVELESNYPQALHQHLEVPVVLTLVEVVVVQLTTKIRVVQVVVELL